VITYFLFCCLHICKTHFLNYTFKILLMICYIQVLSSSVLCHVGVHSSLQWTWRRYWMWCNRRLLERWLMSCFDWLSLLIKVLVVCPFLVKISLMEYLSLLMLVLMLIALDASYLSSTWTTLTEIWTLSDCTTYFKLGVRHLHLLHAVDYCSHFLELLMHLP